MLASRPFSHSAAQLSKASVVPLCKIHGGPRGTLHANSAWVLIHQQCNTSTRHFSSTPQHRMRDFFSEKETANVKTTKAAWPHPIYTYDQMNAVEIAHRDTRNLSDRTALLAVKIMRGFLDLVSGYKHDHAVALNAKDPQQANRKYAMTAHKYMIRNVFLESVAGVPGMVAGMLRHLHSMRRMKRDNGWIETLLEESYNERMHLLTFLRMAEPGPFMRLAVLATQGLFFNFMFVAYLISPRTCHRFVGYLEEEAVITYSREIADLDAGRLPEWENLAAPDIAVTYWNMPEGKRTMRDLLLYIRADEAKHREDQKEDQNPFVSEYKDTSKPHPSKSIEHLKSTGWEREDVV